jgi:hypothetical protein
MQTGVKEGRRPWGKTRECEKLNEVAERRRMKVRDDDEEKVSNDLIDHNGSGLTKPALK